MNRWIGWTLAAVALAASASAGFACDQHAQSAEEKNTKAIAGTGDAKGCDMPCCAHAKSANVVKTAGAATDDKPCAGHDPKGCPKKAGATAAAVAKTEPVQDAVKAEPAADSGTQR